MGMLSRLVGFCATSFLAGNLLTCKNLRPFDSTSRESNDLSAANALRNGDKLQFVAQNLTPFERDSDKVFRDLFAWHLQREGYSQADINHAVYLTPEEFLKVPSTSDPMEFMAAMTDHYKDSVPSTWYDWGLLHPAQARQPLAPKKPVTVVVIPGIFGEFIKSFPFHEIVTDQKSAFYQKWQPAISQIQDEVYSLADLKAVPKPMSDLIKFGSYDIGGKPWVNVIVLQARLGSLETLGTLDSAIPVYTRRLQKVFAAIENESDIYILGYSRGGPVALELISQVTARKDEFPWSARIKGVVGLGSVFYGTKVADLSLDDPMSPIGKALLILQNLVKKLKDRPVQGSRLSKALEETKIMGQNSKAWQEALQQFSALNKGSGSPSGSAEIDGFTQESKLRSQNEKLQSPEVIGNLKYVFDFGTDLFKLDCPVACYFDNVSGFKILVGKVVEGLRTLTVKSRMDWWQQTSLPENIRIFSIAATMPDRIKNGQISKLFANPFYGKSTVDFNKIIRNSFYGNAATEGTEQNDSQVTNFNARYWPSLFPNRKNKSFYLGAMGTHHWGIAFPKAVENANGESNSFPRSALMGAIGSFISELENADNP